ncbi:hybrid sensor histidine kinase/response regulator transcription factor [Bacteroides cellulosilyticus]|uniref:hybrid sensor histidine kinase/response regulator transcription factor n=1 Tax=Bacteroides cellulosilyticus TaxID=246787 RepID=UPI001C37B8A5|nr:hybrid sensor histidine kinase/response regulator transcription factor [Bacteroides cellulosilyticus]MBV3635291.1 response regulator [Bacteroides cellulosilyticus]MBV3661562.1 response regulator [Bacteroides cellulosilyticus]MBV3683631.1 response regulator [Bacteroides cellulosilyticus]MBV3691880.1 response regulator [Bacteroides cellulosilyticus]MBV3705717.1 response regulator [Bacteroides cellulosilyticus]
MKNRHYFPQVSLLICILCCFPHLIHAYSLRQFSNKNGLSNSAILSLYQDHQGVIWIGSCDGLNIFDGTNIHVYNPANPTKASLSGNLINDIMETEKEVLWIQTNYGLDRLDTKHQTSKSFTEFKDKNYMAKSRDNDLFIVKDDGYIYYYQPEKQLFQKLEVPQIAFGHVLSTIIDENNILWIFTSDNDTRSYQINKNKEGITLTPNNLFKHPEQLLWAFAEEDLVYFIDKTYSLYEYDFGNQQQYFIADLKAEVETRGEVSSIIKQQNDYYIGFKSSGLIVLKYMSDQKIKYQMQDTEIHSGIFCLMKDKYQDIVWIGTDGQGVYMYFNDAFSITNTLLDTPVYQINNPVRTVYYDEEQTLWIGTKGGGILRIRNYSLETNAAASFDRISISNSTLTDNTVYCFAPGSANRLWIGTENGLNYYSYQNKQLKAFTVIADGKKVKYVHSINELNDTTLWVSTVGEGIVKVILDKAGNSPSVKSATRIVLDDGRMASNYFFTSFQENDSILWFGNRGYGAYRLNVETEQLTPYRFDNVVNSQTANDIFAIYKNEKGYWLGTSSGLLHFNEDYSHYHDRADLFSNNTVHGILEDQQNNLWISTNQGLVRFNPKTNTGQTYDRENGLEVTEFSDGAFYKDLRTETLFFGGTNGFVTVKPNAYIMADYMPQINLKGLSIFGKEYNIHDFLHDKKGKKILQLDYSQNFFCIDFMAIDYINGNNYSYSYKLDEVSSQWIESGTSASAIFSNLAPGQYTLLVKYKNNMNGKECEPQKLLIQITPPWYLSNWAYILYFILIALFCILAVYRIVHQYRRKQHRMIEKLNREKKEEVYESKLRFFTNITHEFCTPLTLIYGPCEKILAYPQSDSYIRKYGKMIQQNTEKLNGLILELLEFRRLETGHKVLSIQRLSVSDKLRNIAESFCELAENKNLNYRLDIEPDIEWNTDISCFSKIVNNLISNAFKYTPEEGNITIGLKVENQLLTLNISNSGKGIAKENLAKIFDRYKILDSFEMNGKNSRNGLGLAICKNMVTLLNGEINVSSIQNEITTFTVTLPELSPTAQEAETPQKVYETGPLNTNTEPMELEQTAVNFDTSKHTVMIIDDDPSMLWFVSEIFVDKYNVLSFNNAAEALASLELKQPDLIISDVMMPEIDGLSFAQKIKQNKLWSHIPLILLSALHHEDDQVKGIEAGAEVYVTKPFNVKYLEKVVYRLIKRESDLKEYYSSIFSSFKVENGNCIHKEDQEFLDKVIETIEKNITNPDLSVELLSSDLGYSTRQFYRKLKPITDKSPADIIKEYRLTMAERLLLTKNYTIEEIMDKTGFNNRGTFYKLFSQRFGMPPRQYREQQKDSVKKELTDMDSINE